VTNLSPDERKALRKKHRQDKVFTHICKSCFGDYPCDTIVCLDVIDAVAKEAKKFLHSPFDRGVKVGLESMHAIVNTLDMVPKRLP
jgi:hypothetical protein